MQFEPDLLASFQAKWPQYNIAKVTVGPYIQNEAAREAVALGGTFKFFRPRMAPEDDEEGNGKQDESIFCWCV